MEEISYLFIDGGYLNRSWQELFVPIFGSSYPLDYCKIKAAFKARRVFYYDCLDDVPKANEDETVFRARLAAQTEAFDTIDGADGVHVRLGWLSPGKKRHQKEVDVTLAIDMLTNSFAKNMTNAILIAGDRDFRPLVETLVRLGTYVQLVHDPRSSARELVKAADAEVPLTVSHYCDWATLPRHYHRDHLFPAGGVPQFTPDDPVMDYAPTHTLVGSGTIGTSGHPIKLYSAGAFHYASIKIYHGAYRVYNFQDRTVLLKYVASIHGDIQWESPPES
jgi:uncharacterized LabA/DUF88 family protein